MTVCLDTIDDAGNRVPVRSEPTIDPRTDWLDRRRVGVRERYYRSTRRPAQQSRMNKLVALPMYQRMTIRNWNTTKLLALIGQAG